MASACDPKEHIARIRKEKFYIGREEKNPLAGFLHHTVGLLSEELYSKDSHFIMELIQNAEDNQYPPGVIPRLEFVITTKDITNIGAATTLLVFNNEKGFSPANIDSICGGTSIKKGKRHHGYIGEKGIGFKSVFLVTSQPYVFSSGYRIKFNEKPQPDCDIGYIVPEWVDGNPTFDDIHKIYGCSNVLPTTIIILPLKHDKIVSVKKQLSEMHPETLLFLSKIRGLSVREDNPDPKLTMVKAVTIDTETEFQERKNIDAESYILQLGSQENCNAKEECSYYMWRQKFPVRSENKIEKRKEVEEWHITLAFPYQSRLNRGLGSPGIYSYLPTGMVTNFPFIIQADFILASSREHILTDNIWNIGILNCVPVAFTNALVSLVKSVEEAPPSSLPLMFSFLPIKEPSIPILEKVRLSIKERVVEQHIMPCESYTKQRIFSKVKDVGRLDSDFWTILNDARKEGVNLQNLQSHGICIVSSAFDRKKYDDVHEFLGVRYVDNNWYIKCIESSHLVAQSSEKLYLNILIFLAKIWGNNLKSGGIQEMPFLKYVTTNGSVSLWNVNRATKYNDMICLSADVNCISWLINWNKEFECTSGLFFMPESTQKALNCHSKKTDIIKWLSNNANLCSLDASQFAAHVRDSVISNRKMLICLTHFLYHSFHNNYIHEFDLKKMCESMPLVDNYGNISRSRNGVLIPSSHSKWVSLIGSNPWRAHNYVELDVDYVHPVSYAGNHATGKNLLQFLCLYMKASDVPDIHPPNASFPTLYSLLTKENALLLLEWVHNLKQKGVQMSSEFLHCISNRPWLKTTAGNKPPSESFLTSSEWGNLLQLGPLLVDIPLIDQEFYDLKIANYKDELRLLGVILEFGEACKFIGKHLISMGSSNFPRSSVISMLKFIRFLNEKYLSAEYFIKAITEGKWLKSTIGYVSPVGAILRSSEWNPASHICDLPFIDNEYYGDEICSFETELKSLGVIVGFKNNHQLVVHHLKSALPLCSIQANTVTFILECIRNAKSPDQFVSKLKDQKWVRTSLGLKSPKESFLFNPQWDCFFRVVDSLPIVDENFYGSGLRSYHEELKKIGFVTEFEGLSKAIAQRLKERISSSSLTKGHTLELLACWKHLKENKLHAHSEFVKIVRNGKWLKTCLGYRSPSDSILANEEWMSLSSIASLPVIDDSADGYGEKIHEYKEVLEQLHVIVQFDQGWMFVISGIKLPSNVSTINATNILLLLKCIHEVKEDLPEKFINSINKQWLKTDMGYRNPGKCILFDSEWKDVLEHGDAPFIDETFYGSEIITYRPELKKIGVIVDACSGCSLVAEHLHTHSNFAKIERIYNFLCKQKWKPDELELASTLIWIPDGTDSGEWVFPNSCILHDKTNLFSSKLHVLDKYYDRKLLFFFSDSLGVRNGPEMTHYCDLWKGWEDSDHRLTESECSAFWVHVAKHCSKMNIELVSSKLRKFPVLSKLGISLSNRQDVFIPDDLLLKDLLDCDNKEALFVWTPQPRLPFLHLDELYSIYSRLDVQKISQAVNMNESSVPKTIHVMTADLRRCLFNASLYKIILAFLADPSAGTLVERRLDMIKSLIHISVFETEERITVGYNLPLSSGRNLTVKSSRMFRWDKDGSRFFVQKVNVQFNPRTNAEFATNFAQVVSEGLLWEKAELIPKLAEIISLACLLEFDAGAVDYLLKSRNLQLFSDDEQFLLSTLSDNI